MHLSQLLVTASLGLCASAWEITIYNNVRECDANGDTMYRILSGTEQNCYTFDRDMPGVGCAQFNNGGATHGGCGGGSLIPVSAFVKPYGPAQCTFYYEENCVDGNRYSTGFPNRQDTCKNVGYRLSDGFVLDARSFRCTW